MLFTNFLEERQSIRDYKDKMVDKESMSKLKDYISEIRKECKNNKIDFILFEDGKKVYNKLNGIGGYTGVMVRSPHYIGLCISDRSQDTIIKSAYNMEKLLAKIHNLGLGNCWINLFEVPENIKKELFDDDRYFMDYLVAIGYPKKMKSKSKPNSFRLPINDIVYFKEWGNKIDLDILEQRGLLDLFHYIRYAPSNKNNQPWRFIIKDDKILLGILDPDIIENLTDAGIVMYYFEELGKRIGINNKWNILENSKNVSGNEEYKIIAEYYL